jgi:hypothetical protein
MIQKFEMSMMGELKYFLGFQIKQLQDQKVYWSMIGSLLYLCASRPDIMLSVCMCARFQADPKEVHLRAVKRIMRYLVYIPKFGLWYPKGSTFDLIGYYDVDWCGGQISPGSTRRLEGLAKGFGSIILQGHPFVGLGRNCFRNTLTQD